MKVTQSCPALCDLMDYIVHGILQAGILEWVVFPFSRGSSQPRAWTHVSCIAGRFFTSWATREAQSRGICQKKTLSWWRCNAKWNYDVTKPTRMAVIRASEYNKHWQRYEKPANLTHCQWEWKMVRPATEEVLHFLKSLNVKLPWWWCIHQVMPDCCNTMDCSPPGYRRSSWHRL